MTEQNEAAPPPEPAAPALDRPRLKKLVIHRYRHVKPGTTLVFDDTWNVIVGKNGTGKTTLLKLIERLLRPGRDGLGRDPLHVEMELSFLGGIVRTTVASNCTPRNGGPFATDDGELDLRVQGEFLRPGKKQIAWRREASNSWIVLEGHELLALQSLKYAPPAQIVELLTKGSSNGAIASPRFDESHDRFDQTVSWTARRWLDGRIGHTFVTGIAPPAFEASLQNMVGKADAVSWGQDRDPALAAFVELASVDSAVCTVGVHKLDVDPEDKSVTATYGPPVITFGRSNGASFEHNDLSFGQKRLLAFLYYLEMNAPILLVDELSNGFHRNWIDYAVEQMQTRQNFAATQNPLLLDRIPFHSPEELQRSLIFCREEDGKFVWENAKADDMQEVYDAYDVGLEKVSDLLWRKGMW